jgi:hypothetical protein
MRSTSLLCRAAAVAVATISIVAFGLSATPGASAGVPSGTNATGITTGIIHPLSANTCSGSVCIYVVGSGLNVSSWSTTVVLNKSMCSTAKYLENGVVIAASGSTCGSSGEQLESSWASPGNFPNGTQLCNTWTGISGEPCITVHS